MTRRRTLIRSITGYLWYTFVVFVIVLAVTITAARLLLPEAKSYREHVEHWASTLLGEPVQISALDATLDGFTPTLTFKNVRLMDSSGKRTLIHFREARVGIGLWASLRQWRLVPTDLTVVGAKLGVTRYKDGRLAVRGMHAASLAPSGGRDEAASQLTAWLLQRDVLVIKDSEVRWHDLERGKGMLDFSNVNMRLHNSGDRHQLDFDVTLPPRIGHSLTLAVDATGDVTRPGSLQGEFYVRGNALHLSHFGMTPSVDGIAMRSGEIDLTLWGGWRAGALYSLEGTAHTYGLELEAIGHKDPLKLNWLGGRFKWQRSIQGWSLDVAQLRLSRGRSIWPETRLSVVRTGEASGQTPALDVKATFLRLNDLAVVLLKSHKMDTRVRTWLKRLQPDGDVDGIHVHVETPKDGTPTYHAQARFSGLGLKPYGHLPGFENLQGGLWVEGDHGALRIDSRDITLKFPKLFRKDLRLDHILANVDWSHRSGVWNVSARRVIANDDDAHTMSDVLLEIPDDRGSPYLDLVSSFTLDDVTGIPHYLPARIMKPHTVAWLDRAFRAGEVTDGGMVFNGRLADFPYNDHQGQFQVKLHAHNVTLDYHHGWPLLDHIEADLTFTDQGMNIRASRGKVFGSDLKDVRADVARFKDPVLVASGHVEGSTADAVRFLANSPIGASAASTLERLKVGGESSTRLSLRIPLSKRMAAREPLHVKGQVDLHDSSLSLLGGNVDVTQIEGTLHFTDKRQFASGIVARVMGGPAEIDVYTPSGPDPHQTFVRARGHLDTDNIANHDSGTPLLKYFRGKADWQAELALNHDKTKDHAPVVLRVTSDLINTAINLPVPLHKPQGEPCMSVFDAKFQQNGRADLRFDLGRLASVAIGLERKSGRLHVTRGEARFGATNATLPKRKIFRVAGSLNGLSLASWHKVINAWPKTMTLPSLSVSREPVVFDMDRLSVVKGAAGVKKVQPDPRRFPVVRGEIRDLRYGKLDLGALSFDTVRDQSGLTLRSLQLRRPKTVITARGGWHKEGTGQSTVVKAQIRSDDFGGFVRDMGLAAVVSGGVADASVDLSWPATPFGFSFSHLDGRMNISIENGTIEDIDPGAGRVFGLLSLQALPRRLTLDFGDVFKKGFNFDSITGTFLIKSGAARTNNLIVKNPSARILVQGTTGLASHDYNQLVTVVPEVGSSLPIVGGLAWGTQVGAVILLIERLFKSEIDKAAQYQYKITGSWEHPIIKRLAQPKKPPSKPSAKPAPNDNGNDGNVSGGTTDNR